MKNQYMKNQYMNNQNMDFYFDSYEESFPDQGAATIHTYPFPSIHNPTAEDDDCCAVMPAVALPAVRSFADFPASTKRRFMEEAHRHLQAMYDEGAKFLTKKALVDMIRQFDANKAVVAVQPLKGKKLVNFELMKKGDVFDWEYDDDNYACVM